MAVRKVQFAPPVEGGKPPSCLIKKHFLLSPGDLELDLSLDRPVYHPGDKVTLKIILRNYSNKTIHRICASIVQVIDLKLVTTGSYSIEVTKIEAERGCPIHPGQSLNKNLILNLVPDWDVPTSEGSAMALESAGGDFPHEPHPDEEPNPLELAAFESGLLASSSL